MLIFFRREENRRILRKTLEARERINKRDKTHPCFPMLTTFVRLLERISCESGKLTALIYSTYTAHQHSNIELACYCFCFSHPITTYSYSLGKIQYSYSTTTNLVNISRHSYEICSIMAYLYFSKI
jgi:hypothetical protein